MKLVYLNFEKDRDWVCLEGNTVYDIDFNVAFNSQKFLVISQIAGDTACRVYGITDVSQGKEIGASQL